MPTPKYPAAFNTWVDDNMPSSLAAIQAAELRAALQDLMASVTLNRSPNLLIVQPAATATESGTNLLSAYASAVDATPNGATLSETNRLTILLLPGTYDLANNSLYLEASYVDIQGLGSPEQTVITGTTTAPGTGVVWVADETDTSIRALTIHHNANSAASATSHPVGLKLTSSGARLVTLEDLVLKSNNQSCFSAGITIEAAATLGSGIRRFTARRIRCVDNNAPGVFGAGVSVSDGLFENLSNLSGKSLGGTLVRCEFRDLQLMTDGLETSNFARLGALECVFENCSFQSTAFHNAGDANEDNIFTNCSFGDDCFIRTTSPLMTNCTFRKCALGADPFQGAVINCLFEDCLADSGGWSGNLGDGTADGITRFYRCRGFVTSMEELNGVYFEECDFAFSGDMDSVAAQNVVFERCFFNNSGWGAGFVTAVFNRCMFGDNALASASFNLLGTVVVRDSVLPFAGTSVGVVDSVHFIDCKFPFLSTADLALQPPVLAGTTRSLAVFERCEFYNGADVPGVLNDPAAFAQMVDCTAAGTLVTQSALDTGIVQHLRAASGVPAYFTIPSYRFLQSRMS